MIFEPYSHFKNFFAKVRQQNLYHEGDRIPAKQELTQFHLQRCWNDLMAKVNYEDRVAATEKFNKLASYHL